MCPVCRGVSLVRHTRRRRSFNVTSAALDIKLFVTPDAISASVFIEQGAMIMPSVLKDPEAIDALMSLFAWTTSAS